MRTFYLTMLLVCLSWTPFAHRDRDGNRDSDSDTSGSGSTESLWVPDTECTMYYTEDSNDNIQFHNCSSPQLTSSNWPECSQQCCTSSTLEQYPSPTEEALDSCGQFTSGISAFRIAILVLIIIFAITIFFCFFCFLCRKCRARNNLVHSLHNMSQRAHLPPMAVQGVEWEDQMEVNSRVGNGVTWSSRASTSRPLSITEQPCTICLEDNTTTELFCGHQYHPICIGEWLRKSTGCPCCRREDIRGIRIYCNLCRWRYFVCTRTYLSAHSRTVPLRCFDCENVHESLSDNTLSELMPQGYGTKTRMIKVSAKVLEE